MINVWIELSMGASCRDEGEGICYNNECIFACDIGRGYAAGG